MSEILMHIAFFALWGVMLIVSGHFLVKSLIKIAYFLRISEFVVGFVIMAFATSVPELFVGISSALAHNTALALGNVVGANILNLTVVIGIPILLRKGIVIESEKTKTDALYMFFIAALPFILMWIGHGISRVDGIILVGAFFVYAIKLYKERKIFKKEVEDRIKKWEPVAYTFLFLFFLVLLFVSSRFLVFYATLISIDFMLPPILIGLFLVSFGTTLPELVFGTRAALAGHTQMTLGNTIGSVVANSTLVLGITAIIWPITADFLLFITSGIFMLIVAFLFATFVESGNKLYWKEGVSLILLYIFFIIIQFYIRGL